MKKLLYVFNARAGHGESVLKPHLLDIVTRFNQLDYAVTIMTTQHAHHATELVAEYARHFDMVLCSGGDGTVNEVVNGMVRLEEKKPIAYIPTGTTNDYGSSLGLPSEVSACIDRITGGDPFPVDVGLLNDKAFVYVAAMGIPVKVSYTTSQAEKNIWGYWAYVSELFKVLPETRAFHLSIETPERSWKGEYLIAFITNSKQVSGVKGITGKDVSLNDGLFEVTLVKNVKNIAELIVHLPTLASGQPDPKYVERFKVKEMQIHCDEEIEWNLDGEFGGKARDAKISVLESAVSFLV